MASDKFGRNYALAIQTQDGSVLNVDPNLTVEFDITRNTFGSANVGSIRVYNLSVNHRNSVRKNITDVTNYRSVIFRAGYGNNLPIVFAGNITQCWSVREGNNFVTSIESFDGGFAFVNGFTDTTFPANTLYTSIMSSLITNDLPHVTIGKIGSFEGSLSRDNTYSGNTVDILKDITGNGFFIDNEKAYCLLDNECINGQAQVINSASGLLGTPVLEQTILTFDLLFEPSLKVSQQILLESSTAQNFNGVYKVISVKHRGMISPAICGQAVTSVGLDSFPVLLLV